MTQPDKDEMCGNCGHEYKFHIGLGGEAVQCDAEFEVKGEEVKEPGMHQVYESLCGCPQFVWIGEVEPEEVEKS